MKTLNEKIKFPKDELPHKNIVEWWYFNGHLKSKNGKKYAYMHCLFKVDLKTLAKKFKIPLIGKIPLAPLYFFNTVISDINSKKSYKLINHISRVSGKSFSKPLLFVEYQNFIGTKFYFVNYKKYFNKSFEYQIEEKKKFEYRLKTENLDIKLKSAKKPLLEAGTGYVDLNGKKTYYYSLTNLRTAGTIKIEGKTVKVRGKSWMDHQWTDVIEKNKWTWFSIQLNNNSEIICFEYYDGKLKTYLAGISYPNNKQEHTSKVFFTQTGTKWTSPATKAKYPLAWRIEIPSKKISLQAKPLIKNQEMVFGTINYWEGPVDFIGTFDGKKVRGKGFLELVGSPGKFISIDFLKYVLKEVLGRK